MATSTTELFTGPGTLYQKTGEVDDEPFYEPLGSFNGFTMSVEERTPKAKTPNERFFIVVKEDQEMILEQPITIHLQLQYSIPTVSVHWRSMIEGKLECLAFRFAVRDGVATPEQARMRTEQMSEVYNRCFYCLLSGCAYVDDEKEEDPYLRDCGTHTMGSEDEDEPAFAFDAGQINSVNIGSGNICAVESIPFHRMLVMKQGNEANSLEMQALPRREGGFNPKEMERLVVKEVDGSATDSLLESGDIKMLLFGGRSGAAQQIDLARGEVVQEYKPADLPMQSVTYANHTADASGSVYTCLARNVAFNIDTRVNPRSCLVMEEGKTPSDYALQALRKDFTCHATSENGYLVIGDATGSVRLYSGPPGARKPEGGYFPKAAKTLLETKTPITSVDVTADGRYIVATTEKFLLFINTQFLATEGKETSGFEKRMGKQKPQPVMLQLTPEDTQAMGGIDAVRFQRARFDRFETKELLVSASCGGHIVTWSLKAIEAAQKSGRVVPYSTASIGQTVLHTSANHTSQVTFLTDRNIGEVPVHEVTRKVRQAWTWGQE